LNQEFFTDPVKILNNNEDDIDANKNEEIN
jgi:hypothetical protein